MVCQEILSVTELPLLSLQCQPLIEREKGLGAWKWWSLLWSGAEISVPGDDLLCQVLCPRGNHVVQFQS